MPEVKLEDVLFPVVRRKIRPSAAPPLRRGIDYHSPVQRTFPAFTCANCGGPLFSPSDHEKDSEACESEKVRQVMES